MVLSRNPVHSAVALAAVLGSATVEIPATNILTILGLRASKLANVGFGVVEFCDAHCVVIVHETDFLLSMTEHSVRVFEGMAEVTGTEDSSRPGTSSSATTATVASGATSTLA